VPYYGHAGGSDIDALKEHVHRNKEEGNMVIRVQMSGYGGGGFIGVRTSVCRLRVTK
jgi:mannonate dehydratase